MSTDQLPTLRAAHAAAVGAQAPPSTDATPPSTTTTRPKRKAAKPTTTLARPLDALAVSDTATPSGDPAGDDVVWARLRKCESGGRYDLNTGNGYYGAYQFAAGTWRKLGYPGLPHESPPATQDEAARRLQAKLGWGQWPACSRQLGLR